MKQGQSSQVVSMVLLLLIVVGTVVFILPMRDEVTLLKANKVTAEGELLALDTEYNSLSALSAEVAKSEATRTALLSAVPSYPSQDSLILELSAIAVASNFDLNAMSFSEETDANYGNILLTTINVSGEYSDLQTFLQQLESAKRLLRVKSLSVQLTSETTVSLNLAIEAFYQPSTRVLDNSVAEPQQ